VVVSERAPAPALAVERDDVAALDPDDGWSRSRPWLTWADRAAVAGAVLVGLVLRFVAVSPLWLDEALSVNIARLPIGQIPEALRHDGHPPLYYLLLHLWMNVFGTGDGAVRALSGLFGVVLLPLTWVAAKRIAGRRGAWMALAVVAVAPFALRYSTETRMYSLVMVLALAGYLIADDALHRPTPLRLVALALAAAGLLYSHYWSMWFLAAAAVGLLWVARRARWAGRADERRAALRVVGALVAGGVLFLPWVPSLLYQGAHTGTPWGARVLPSAMVTNTLADLGGGPNAEAVLYGGICAVVVLVAVFARGLSRRYLEVDLFTQPDSRSLLYLFSATIAMAAAASYATQTTFVTRYTSVVFPFFMLLVALGLTRFKAPLVMRLVMVALLVLGAVGAGRDSFGQLRTQARADAKAIVATAHPGDVIAYCPDQLGPAGSRELAGKGPFDQVTYPLFKPPQRVDWADYTKVLAQASPARFAAQLQARARRHQIFVVWQTGYATHKRTCDRVIAALSKLRPIHSQLVTGAGDKYYEPSSVWRFRAAASAR